MLKQRHLKTQDYVIFARQMKLKINFIFYSPVKFMTIYVQNYLVKQQTVSEKYSLFKSLDTNSKILFLFIKRSIAAWFYQCMNCRQNMLFQKWCYEF